MDPSLDGDYIDTNQLYSTIAVYGDESVIVNILWPLRGIYAALLNINAKFRLITYLPFTYVKIIICTKVNIPRQI